MSSRGPRQIRPGRIYQTVTNLLNHRIIDSAKVQKPIWYNVVESIPPSETVVRPLPPQHKVFNPNSKKRKPSRLFQPQQLVYEEDALRDRFYQDHPWELARPRMIVEMDGRDAERYDWSTGLYQPGMPLCGECVVQRQMWMMYNVPGMTKDRAYDIVRREFYLLRQQEDVQRRIAQEEARKVGAYFGKSHMQVGMELEDQVYEGWKKWAGKELQEQVAQQDAAYTNFGAGDGAEDADPDSSDAAEESYGGGDAAGPEKNTNTSPADLIPR
ncbi:37S ribosomal protein S25 [Nemania sp. FL0916]|nr:37S ribosomal protein S25 [Nemania sp. FL0916]